MKITEKHIGKRVRILDKSPLKGGEGILVSYNILKKYSESASFNVYIGGLDKSFSTNGKSHWVYNVELIDDDPEFDVDKLKGRLLELISTISRILQNEDKNSCCHRTLRHNYAMLLSNIECGDFNKKPPAEKKLKPVNEACLFKPVIYQDRKVFLIKIDVKNNEAFFIDPKVFNVEIPSVGLGEYAVGYNLSTVDDLSRDKKTEYGDGGNYE